MEIVRDEPGPDCRIGSGEKDQCQARHDRRNRERQVDKCDQESLAGKIELCDCPGCRDTEDSVQRHRNRGDDKCQVDCRKSVGGSKRCQSRYPPLPQGLGEHGNQRGKEKHGDQCEGRTDQEIACKGRFRRDGRWPDENTIRQDQSSVCSRSGWR